MALATISGEDGTQDQTLRVNIGEYVFFRFNRGF